VAQPDGAQPGRSAGAGEFGGEAGVLGAPREVGDLGVGIAGAAGTLLPEDDDEVTAWGQQLLGQWGSRIGGGTDQVQRNVISERVLGLPGDVRVDKSVRFPRPAQVARERVLLGR